MKRLRRTAQLTPGSPGTSTRWSGGRPETKLSLQPTQRNDQNRRVETKSSIAPDPRRCKCIDMCKYICTYAPREMTLVQDLTGKLGRRERQILDAVYRRGRATAAEVLEDLPDDPSYSSVRGMLRHIEGKGHLRHERDGSRHVYMPTAPAQEVRTSALWHVIKTFFGGSAASAASALIEARPLTQKEYEHISRLLEEAPREADS